MLVDPGQVDIPLVGLGTWQYNDTVAEAATTMALGLGYTHIDTAIGYGNQVGIGKALAASPRKRESYFITSKIPGGLSYDDAMSNLTESVKQVPPPCARADRLHSCRGDRDRGSGGDRGGGIMVVVVVPACDSPPRAACAARDRLRRSNAGALPRDLGRRGRQGRPAGAMEGNGGLRQGRQGQGHWCGAFLLSPRRPRLSASLPAHGHTRQLD